MTKTVKFKFECGIIARDVVTQLEGVIISRTEHLNGCIQYAIKPPMIKKGEMPDAWMVDEAQLEKIGPKIKPNEKTIKPKRTGGPSTRVPSKPV